MKFKKLSWGVDGFGNRHFDCKYCKQYFGKLNWDDVFVLDNTHKCKK